MLVIDHPVIGPRFSHTLETMASANNAQVRYEKTVDAKTESGQFGRAHLYSVDGSLFQGDCIMIPAVNKRGVAVSLMTCESLAEQFLKDTIKHCKRALAADVLDSTEVTVEAGRESNKRTMTAENIALIERIAKDKLASRK